MINRAWEVVEEFLLSEDIPPSVVAEVVLDGTAKPNPGHGGAAAIVRDIDTGRVLAYRSVYLGNGVSNNMAEHCAFGVGLDLLIELGKVTEVQHVEVLTDSQFFVEHWEGRSPQNFDLVSALSDLRKVALDNKLVNLTVRWVPREQVSATDHLVRNTLKGRGDAERRESPNWRILHNDIFPLADSFGWSLQTRDPGYIESTGPVDLTYWPFYSRRTDGGIVPSVDERTWRSTHERSTRRGKLVVALWRPYGSYPVAVPAKVVPVEFGGFEADWPLPMMSCPVSSLQEGTRTDRRAYNGFPVHLIDTNAAWLPATEMNVWLSRLIP